MLFIEYMIDTSIIIQLEKLHIILYSIEVSALNPKYTEVTDKIQLQWLTSLRGIHEVFLQIQVFITKTNEHIHFWKEVQYY